MATERQLVLDLKAELQKVKETARVASEAAEVEKTTSYECGVLDMETRLGEEVAGVCRDYYIETWAEALNRARVPATSEMRSAENIFFPEDIIENPTILLPPEQLPTTQAPPLDAEVSKGTGMDKEAQPPM